MLEDAFHHLARRLPPHERNVWVDGVFVDAVWHEQRVVVELDSRGFHAHDAAFEGDRRKANALQVRGWIVLRFTYRRIKREPDAVVAEVLAALSRSNSSLREQFDRVM